MGRAPLRKDARGGLCFSGWVRRWIIPHRKELTAVWRRGHGPELASLRRTLFSWKGYWSLDEGRGTSQGGAALRRRAQPPPPPPPTLPPGPARGDRDPDGASDSTGGERRAWPRAAATPWHRGAGLPGAGPARATFSVHESRARRRPSEAADAPCRARGAGASLGPSPASVWAQLASPDLGWPRPRPRCGWAAPVLTPGRLPGHPYRAVTMVPRCLDLRGPGRRVTPHWGWPAKLPRSQQRRDLLVFTLTK